MSSKILRTDSIKTEPMPWRRGPGSPPAPMGGQQVASPSVPASQPGPDIEREMARRAEEAYHRGLAEGETRGHRAGTQQVQAAVDRLARSCAEIAGLKRKYQREAEADLVRLAMAIARRVLRRELTVDPHALLGLVKAGLERLDARELNRIRVHPDVAPWLTTRLEAEGLPRRVEVVADPSLEPGAAIFESQRGTLDASVETQLGEIERGFVDLLEPGA